MEPWKPIDAEDVLGGSWNVDGLSQKSGSPLLCDDTFTVESPGLEQLRYPWGIALSQLDSRTMEFREHPGLFAVGEALDVDGITGGYNPQFAFPPLGLRRSPRKAPGVIPRRRVCASRRKNKAFPGGGATSQPPGLFLWCAAPSTEE